MFLIDSVHQVNPTQQDGEEIKGVRSYLRLISIETIIFFFECFLITVYQQKDKKEKVKAEPEPVSPFVAKAKKKLLKKLGTEPSDEAVGRKTLYCLLLE